MLIIYVDADACPVKDEIYRVARRYDMLVKVVAKVTLAVPTDPHIELIVRSGFGDVDDWIASKVGPGDIVVTFDLLLPTITQKTGTIANPPSASKRGGEHRQDEIMRGSRADVRNTAAVAAHANGMIALPGRSW